MPGSRGSLVIVQAVTSLSLLAAYHPEEERCWSCLWAPNGRGQATLGAVWPHSAQGCCWTASQRLSEQKQTDSHAGGVWHLSALSAQFPSALRRKWVSISGTELDPCHAGVPAGAQGEDEAGDGPWLLCPRTQVSVKAEGFPGPRSITLPPANARQPRSQEKLSLSPECQSSPLQTRSVNRYLLSPFFHGNRIFRSADGPCP